MSNERATENAGFLDGRDYTAAFLYEFFALLVGNGVYTNELAPTATNEDMTITHGAGHAWINGVCYKNSNPFVLNIATADGALNRYDSLMLRLDLSANEVYALIVQGAYATEPTPPACVRNAETHDLKICDIYVPAGCTKITQAQITDRRLDASVCGVPVFPVQHMDMTSFYRQIVNDLANFRQRSEADFAAWVEDQEESHLATMAELVEVVRRTSDGSVMEILALLQQLNDLVDADTVGQLIIAIRALESKTTQIENDITEAEAIAKAYTDTARIIVKNKAVSKGAFIADETYEDFGFRAAVPIAGVTSTMIPEVMFGVSTMEQVGFAPVAESYNGGIYLYADAQPMYDIVIPTIILWRGDSV